MIKTLSRAVLAVACLIGFMQGETAFCSDIVPFDSFNQSPLISLFGLPGPGNFLVLGEKQTETAMNVVLSSNYTLNDNGREQILLDGETTRFTLTVRHAFLPRVEAGLKIPYVYHSGGFLDGFIEGYHSTFGFPQGGRDRAPRDRLLYQYRRDGRERIRLDSSGAGVGDIRLTAALQVEEKRESNQGMTLNFSLKLPTGDSDQLRGSGSTDISLWFSGGTGGRIGDGAWGSYASAGMLFMTTGNILPEQQKNWVGFGSLGVGWAPLAWLSLKVQADGHTPFFSDSDLKEIAANAVQLIVGGTVSFSQATTLDIGVGEDLIVGTAPDVSFYLTLRNRF